MGSNDARTGLSFSVHLVLREKTVAAVLSFHDIQQRDSKRATMHELLIRGAENLSKSERISRTASSLPSCVSCGKCNGKWIGFMELFLYMRFE
jgi:hypothetical protein